MKSLLCPVLLYSCMMSSTCATYWPFSIYLSKWLITGWLKWRVPLVEQERLHLPDHLSTPCFRKVGSHCPMFSFLFCRLMFAHLSFFFDLRFSDYPVGSFWSTCWYFLIILLVFSDYPVGIFWLTCWYFLINLLVFSY